MSIRSIVTRPAEELLFDSETSLRLVDSALIDLRVSHISGLDSTGIEESVPVPDPAESAQLPSYIRHARSELSRALENLRDSRSGLQHTANQMLQHTTAGVRGVFSPTEWTAADRLEGLNRTLALVHAWEAARLDRTSGVLAETEERLLKLLHLFDSRRLGKPEATSGAAGREAAEGEGAES